MLKEEGIEIESDVQQAAAPATASADVQVCLAKLRSILGFMCLREAPTLIAVQSLYTLLLGCKQATSRRLLWAQEMAVCKSDPQAGFVLRSSLASCNILAPGE